MNPPIRKALALISGGLDSMLAARVMQEQGIHVEGVNFYTGFCVEGHTHAIRRQDQNKLKRNNALWVAEQLGIRLHIVDIIDEYKNVVLNPRHGYGSNLNPCLDCKVFMVGKAREWIAENGFDFIVTGEVIGQRPMSQRRDTMRVVSRDSWRAFLARHPAGAARENSLPANFSGAEDCLLRPLCAKNLAPTLPEREGWVDRDKLYGFNGRSRKPQMDLARQFGLTDYAQPAGGCCFLTDESYSRKLADLWQARGKRDYELDDIMLLKVGRHIRPRPHFKLIVAREEGEGNFLQGYRSSYIHLYPVSHAGPLVLIDGEIDDNDAALAARILARFSQGRDADSVEVALARAGETRLLRVSPLPPQELPAEWYV
jgi:tRNA U34 2-thiouridine synthase MnmA/TrmU